MRLSDARIERALTQFDASAVPETHPAVPRLSELYGDHTFFLDRNGLHILEPAQPTSDGVATGKLINLADWTDADRTSLAAHEPELTDVVVVLGAEEPNQ